MPLPPATRRTVPHQLTLPFALPQQRLALPSSPTPIEVGPHQIWNTLSPMQRNELRQQLIQILQEVLRHGNSHE